LEEMEFNSKKGKIELLNDLLEPLYVQTKTGKKFSRKDEKTKDDSCII